MIGPRRLAQWLQTTRAVLSEIGYAIGALIAVE
jgi:hypothetical protein